MHPSSPTIWAWPKSFGGPLQDVRGRTSGGILLAFQIQAALGAASCITILGILQRYCHCSQLGCRRQENAGNFAASSSSSFTPVSELGECHAHGTSATRSIETLLTTRDLAIIARHRAIRLL